MGGIGREQEDLFALKQLSKEMPLARRMCPVSLEEFVGQEHLLGKGKLLRRIIEADRLTSLILYGPPGVGKTSLGVAIAQRTKANFERLNAVTAKIADLRRAIQTSKDRILKQRLKTILFIDEIHRFNKLQQDALLPDVEEGNIILIGATIHNPFFSVISGLISRSHVFELFPLSLEEIKVILKRALSDRERGFGQKKIIISEEALNHLASSADGDARRALNALEIGVLSTPPAEDGSIHFDLSVAIESVQKKPVRYDKDEDEHYDTISAFIKSMRGSDPDATLYYLAKMIYAGEDPRFIARRIVIAAAEDVGNADPQALVLANAALQVSEFVGLPEARIPLAQAAVYIACAPKSNAAYLGIEEAMKEVQEKRAKEVPPPLKVGTYPGAKKLGRGINYKYPHSYAEGFVEQEYLGEKKIYYRPTSRGYEKVIKEWMESLKKKKSGGED